MYERHFGISGLPFQLSPDPSFYFDAAQHRVALAALRRFIDAPLQCLVLSGAIGAGKTTVLRTWLHEVHQAGHAHVLITNTLLDADGLMSAVLLALGVTPQDDAAKPMVHLRRHLRGLAGNALVLAIDEAQNLDRDGLASLIKLSDVASEERVRLRIVLAGQPELRSHVADHALPKLQAMLQQACHLKPLGASDTRRYIEHRLNKVGWSGAPSFDEAAFEEIHRLAGGVPRRINVVTNRLLLAQFLKGSARVRRQDVQDVGLALDTEVFDGIVTPDSPGDRPPRQAAKRSTPTLFLLASGRSDWLKALALLSAIERRAADIAPVMVGLRNLETWALNADLWAGLRAPPQLVDLSGWVSTSEERRFEAELDKHVPRAVLVFDGDDLLHRCVLSARQRGIPVVQVDAEAQTLADLHDPASPRAAIARIADMRFCSSGACVTAGATQATQVGSLLVDALRLATSEATRGPEIANVMLSIRRFRESRRGFGVVLLKRSQTEGANPCSPRLIGLLQEIGRDLPWVLPLRGAGLAQLPAGKLQRALEGGSIVVVGELGYIDLARLMREATCVLTNSPDVAEEAAILAVPCLSVEMNHVAVSPGGWLQVTDVGAGTAAATRAIWRILFAGGARSRLPAGWDGHAGDRIARMLMRWLGLAGAPAEVGSASPIHEFSADQGGRHR